MQQKHESRISKSSVQLYEVQTVAGLEAFAGDEIAAKCSGATLFPQRPGEGRIHVAYSGDSSSFNSLRSSLAVYLLSTFDTPRPRGLLGNENFSRLLALARSVISKFPGDTFRTLGVSAAGRDSPAFRRISASLCQELGMTDGGLKADLAINVRRSFRCKEGWDVLLRLTPRPLSVRPWRVCDLPGAINASVAYVAVALTRPSSKQRFLNLACGSGTLLIERLQSAQAGHAIGADVDPDAIRCSAVNLSASGHSMAADLLVADAMQLPFDDRAFEALAADLPWGMLVKRPVENRIFYPAFLREAARVAAPEALMSIITNDHRAFRRALSEASNWIHKDTVEFKLPYRSGWISPAIYLNERSGE